MKWLRGIINEFRVAIKKHNPETTTVTYLGKVDIVIGDRR